MELLTAGAPAFASIVGLLNDFQAHRSSGTVGDIVEFTEWLRTHGHSEIIQAIESNQKTSIGIKAALAMNQRDLVAKLQRIDASLLALCEMAGIFGGVSNELYRELPSSLLSQLRTRTSKGRVKEILGTHHLQSNDTWWYCCPNGFVQIEFRESGGIAAVAVALSAATPDMQFDVPFLSVPLGQLSLADVMAVGGELSYRFTMRTEEILCLVRVGPPGAGLFITFGALWPHTEVRLRPSEFCWDREADALVSPPENVLINWIAISDSMEEIWFDWAVFL